MLRLTLRTLLAYLDDTLSPAEARDIGHQVSQEPALNELIARIKSVMRRRRLMADSPDPDRAKLDPNDLAEYLDSMLGPARVVDLEKRLLENDLDLAEVASVHQILSLVLGKPAEVSPAAKERMYRLVTARSRPHTEMAPIGPKRIEAAGRSAAGRAFEPVPLAMPSSPSAASRAGAFSLILALFAALGVMVYITLSGSGRRPIPRIAAANKASEELTPSADAGEPASPDEAEASDEVSPTETPPQESAETLPTLETPAPSSPETEPLAPLAPPTAIPTPDEVRKAGPALDEGEQPPPPVPPAPPKPEPVPGLTPAPTEPAPEETAVAVAPVVPPPAPPAAPAIDLTIPIGTYESPTGILLRRNDNGWMRIQSKEKLFPLDRIAAPWPERAKVRFRDNMTAELSQNAWVDVMSDPNASASLALLEGRMVVGVEDKPATLLLALGREPATVKLIPSTSLAVEVRAIAPPRAGNAARTPVIEIEIFVIRGQIQIDEGARKFEAGEKQRVRLRSVGGEDEVYPIEATDAPDWVDAKPPSEEVKLSKRLSDEISYRVDPAPRYRELCRANDKDLCRAAVWGLASLGEAAPVLDALESKYPDVRATAMEALRSLARQGSDSLAAVKTAVNLAYRGGLADELLDLLLGFDNADRTKVATYRRLVALLENPEMKVRQAAIYNLKELRGVDYGFDAKDSLVQSRKSVDQWKRWLNDQKDETISEDKRLLVPGRD